MCALNTSASKLPDLLTICAISLQASPRLQTDEALVKDISDKLDQGNVTESIFDAVQAKVILLYSSSSDSHNFTFI